MAQTHRLFSTPFVRDELQSEAGIAALRQEIEAEHVRDGEGVNISNIGGWHSNTQMLTWGGEAARALAFIAMTMPDALTQDAKSPKASRFGWVPEI